jgi:plastocyanin domain-containing protein
MKQTTLFVIVMGVIIVAALTIVLGAKGPNSNGNLIAEGGAQKLVVSARNAQYSPQTLTVKAGQPVELTLDSSVQGCLRDFTIRELGIHQYLETPQDVLRFTPQKKGTYQFACSMGMAFGTLKVE